MEVKNKISFHHLFWYFIIFSVLGLLIETLFCYITMGIIESRKGLLYGPFCPIYGIGAACLIYILDKYKNNNKKIFIYGAIAGSVIEYVLSFGLEAIYGSRFWDYEYKPFNLNGRICLTFSIYWGILSLLLMKGIRPKIDNYIDKLSGKKAAILDSLLLIFLIIDVIMTVWAINTYQDRVKAQYYNIEVYQEDNLKNKIENKLFSNEIMLKTFPNLRIRDNEDNLIFIRDIIK